MKPEEFEPLLRSFLHRKPFVPFAVILHSGERFEVDHANAVAFSSEAAGFFAADGEIHLVDCEQVAQMLAIPQEAAS
jgi:hypothetical protein